MFAWWFWIVPIAVVLVKLWLTSHLPILASYGGYDSLRYIMMAREMVSPGIPEYDMLTLMRNPGYPAFIAASYWLGLSLRFAQELFYLLAGCFFAGTVFFYQRKPIVPVVFITVYSWMPMAFFWNRKAIQEAVYLPLILFILACLIHLWKADICSRQFLGWSLALGLLLSWFWNIRPEAILIVPTFFLTFGGIFVKILLSGKLGEVFAKKRGWGQLAGAIALMVVPPVTVTMGICAFNYHHYGLFVTSDFTTPGVLSAYGNLTRVQPNSFRRMVPVPKSARESAYEVSESFRQLRGYLETDRGEVWRKASCSRTHICDDYAGGWFIWALRNAVNEAGYYESAPRTEAFYQQIGEEIATACENGEITCREPSWLGSGLAPVPRSEYLQPFLNSLQDLADSLLREPLKLTRYSWDYSLALNPSEGETDKEWRRRYFAKITREPADFIDRRQKPFNQSKDKIIFAIARIFRWGYPWFVGCGVVGLVVELYYSWRYPYTRDSLGAWVMLLALSYLVVRWVLFSYIDATSYPIKFRYLLPVAPLPWLCFAMGVAYLWQRFRGKQKRTREEQS